MKREFILLGLLLASSVHADNEKENFRNEITGNLEKILCDESYLKCLRRKPDECEVAIKHSITNCSIDAAYKAVSDTYNNEKEAFEKIRNEGVQYGDCISAHVFRYLNVDIEVAKKCESPMLDKKDGM